MAYFPSPSTLLTAQLTVDGFSYTLTSPGREPSVALGEASAKRLLDELAWAHPAEMLRRAREWGCVEIVADGRRQLCRKAAGDAAEAMPKLFPRPAKWRKPTTNGTDDAERGACLMRRVEAVRARHGALQPSSRVERKPG